MFPFTLFYLLYNWYHLFKSFQWSRQKTAPTPLSHKNSIVLMTMTPQSLCDLFKLEDRQEKSLRYGIEPINTNVLACVVDPYWISIQKLLVPDPYSEYGPTHVNIG